VIMLFAVSPSLILGCLLLFVAGLTSTAFGTIIATFIQVEAPNDLRGRIMSLYAITLIGLPSLGALGSGAVAQALGGIQGAPRAVLIGGVLTALLVAGFGPFFWKRVIDAANRR
jgi:hypothetical protein